MNLIIEHASANEQEDMVLPYFNFFTALYGKSIATNAIGRRIETGKNISPVLTYFDRNYDKALDAIDSAYGDDEYMTMLKISTSDYIDPKTGKPLVIAYARLNWALETNVPIEEIEEDLNFTESDFPYGSWEEDEDDEEYTKEPEKIRNIKNAGIHDVVFRVSMSEPRAEEFYLSFARTLENWIAERSDVVEMVSHEVPYNNDAYLNAMFNAGDYEHDSNARSITVMFDKYIRNKPLSRKIKQ